jgi:4-hydroxy-3-polyprenylbenzoate decarboxylase
MPGILAIECNSFKNYEQAEIELNNICVELKSVFTSMNNFPMIVLCDDSEFVAETLNNFLWITFTRCNPANDLYGVDSFTHNKHWCCKGSLIFDSRKKPHHAPELIKDDAIEQKIDSYSFLEDLIRCK